MPNKSSISNARSYKDIGAFWDEHDATEMGELIDAEFEVDIHSQVCYYPIDNRLAGNIQKIAEQRGISEETLINLWVQEKLNQIHAIEES